MIAANEFSRSSRSSTSQPPAPFIPRRTSSLSEVFQAPVKVILDIDRQNYDFKVQAGALRRVLQNLFGNAQKYTEQGFIMVRLGIQKQDTFDNESEDP
jgi:signal transduction histidine kinase